MRASIVRILFEREAYKNPEQNLTKLYWNVVSKILGVPSHPELNNWAGIIHYTSHPVYFQNYLIADLISAQFKAFLNKKQRKIIDNPETGKFFINEILCKAAVNHWDQLLEQVTGEGLTPRYFIDEILK